jgi:hypothetical protein
MHERAIDEARQSKSACAFSVGLRAAKHSEKQCRASPASPNSSSGEWQNLEREENF